MVPVEQGNDINDGGLRAQMNATLHSTSDFISDLINDRRRRIEYERLDGSNSAECISASITSSNINYTENAGLTEINLDASRERLGSCKNVSNGEYQDDVSDTQTRSGKEDIWFLLYLFLFCGYLVIGGLCFQWIEAPVEKLAREAFKNARRLFVQKYPEVKEDDLEAFLSEVVKANDRGLLPLRNATPELNWGFGQALFFSSTVITTIGYGHVTPLSQTGKIFCMIYATIGIPLTLVLLTAVVERLLIPANWLLGSLNAKLGHLYQPFNIRLLHLFIIIVIVGILFFGIPTAVFAYLEPTWGVLDAFYYCFISLATIGLGDYIPGDGVSVENKSLYKICITFYLISGLIGIMLALTVFYDIPQLNLGQLFTENSATESEKLRLSGSTAPCYSGPSGLYIPQRDEDMRRAVVRIRPHGEESPSPDEHPTNNMNRDLRVP